MSWHDITDLRFCNTHDKVSPTFAHGPHEGLPVEDLAQSFMLDQERPEALPPLVAAGWRGGLYVVFGNRRLWALLEYRRRHRPWTIEPHRYVSSCTNFLLTISSQNV